ncbi:TerB family tellurite resistance protein [Xanthobacteraceae bacterium A53D]
MHRDAGPARTHADMFSGGCLHCVFDRPPDHLSGVTRVLNLAGKDTAGLEAYARQIGSRFADQPETREDLLDALFHVAKADHALHPSELDFMHKMAGLLGFDDVAYERIEARHVRRPGDPYAVLDLPHDATDAEIKTRWRQLVSAHHPDRLQARGLSPAAIRLANDRIAAVNAAYAEIQQKRENR